MSPSSAPAIDPAPQRYWEIDALRGAAVVAMVGFHLMWDLFAVGLSSIDVFSGGWQAFARGIGSTFTLLLGLSAVLTDARYGGSHRARFVRRGVWVLAFGVLVSAGTYAAVGAAYVRFGILHLQGVLLLLMPLLLRLRAQQAAAVGVAMIAAGGLLSRFAVPWPWLLWLGLPPQGVDMVDYYPLLPWGGAALLGIAAGRWIYLRGRRPAVFDLFSLPSGTRMLGWLGRHSLALYLIHQPIIIGMLLALGFQLSA